MEIKLIPECIEQENGSLRFDFFVDCNGLVVSFASISEQDKIICIILIEGMDVDRVNEFETLTEARYFVQDLFDSTAAALEQLENANGINLLMEIGRAREMAIKQKSKIYIVSDGLNLYLMNNKYMQAPAITDMLRVEALEIIHIFNPYTIA